MILFLGVIIGICCSTNGFFSGAARATVPPYVTLSLAVAPDYDQKTQNFTVYGILDNASGSTLDNISVQLVRSSRIDRVEDLPSQQSHWHFQPQFISAPVHISTLIEPYSRIAFAINSSLDPKAPNFLHLPSPGVFGFEVIAKYTSQENPQPDFQVDDSFSYTFSDKDDLAENKTSHTNPQSHHKPIPEMTFISFHAVPSLAPGYPRGEQFVTVKNSALLDSLSVGPLAKTLTAVESLVHQPHSYNSYCLSIDPDLLITVNALTEGYSIANKIYPRSEIAHNWLQRLRAVAKNNCVVSEPFSNVDMNFIAHSQLMDLYHSSVMGPELIEKILLTPVNPTILYTGQQVLGPAAVKLLDNLGIHTLIGQTTESCPENMQCLPINFRNSTYPWKSNKPVESALAEVARLDLTIERSSQFPHPLIIGIEPGYDANSRTSGFLLHTIADYHASHQFKVLDLTKYLQLLARRHPVTTSGGNPTAGISMESNPAESQYFPWDTSALRLSLRVLNILNLLFSLSQNTRDAHAAITFYSPLREDILRAYSVLNKIPSKTSLQQHQAYVQRELHLTAASLTLISDQIQVLSPTTTYTLTSHKSPLILAIKNGIPLTIQVNVMVRGPQGFSVQNKDAVVIPPLSERQLKLPTYSAFSRYTSILVQLQSSTGILLNSPVQISIYANAYGHWLVYLAIIAGSILVLLLLRRLYLRLYAKNRPRNSRNPSPTPEQKRFTVSPLRLKRSANVSRFSDRDDF